MHVEGLTRVATYQRRVSASTERVWENVRDWEHLPWLHNQSFRSLEHLESGDWGWRVEVELASPASQTIALELMIDGAQYVSRTTAGVGAGSEIWTTVTAVDDHRTDIEVEFHLPDVKSDQIPAMGAAYTALYAQLWDEDEQMMMLRESRLASRALPMPSGLTIELGPLAALRGALPLEVEFGGRPYRVVELDGRLRVYSVICPHRLGPLGAPDLDGRISCPWHGWKYDLRLGHSCDGNQARLFGAPNLVVDPITSTVSLRSD